MSGPLSLIVKAAIALLVIWVIVHDVASVLLTHYGADDIAQSVANAAATTWRTSNKDQEATVETAIKVAEQKGASLLGFTAEDEELLVKIKVIPRDTVLARYIDPVQKFGNGEAIAGAPIE
ncbi:MAG: hypothetical protein ACYC1U_09080 [Candidatus Aquicultorales bacterium]